MPLQKVTQMYQQSKRLNAVNRQRAMTPDVMASPFNGCCNFFDNCSDGVMNLHFFGTLGTDVLRQCRRMTFNFESMCFILE